MLGLVVLTLAAAAPSPGAALSVRVAGNELVDGDGNTLRLLGVNRSSFEYACAQGWGFNEGYTDASSIAAMASWGINVVRIPLNEACWLGLSSVDRDYRGHLYRDEVIAYVQRLHDAGLYVILDLHWNAPGSQPALGQRVMADADHSPAFWKSVAKTFLADTAIIFDVYNEPHDISWSCWKKGCKTSGGWKAAGMQKLVDAIRKTGNTQPIMLGGNGWAGDLTGWLQWKPKDRENALVVSVHNYNFGSCVTEACWDGEIAPVAAQVPVVTGELGEDDCDHSYVDDYMDWADAHGISYLGWTWNVWDCNDGPALITDYDGTPTAFGAGVRDHFLSL